MKDIRIHRTRGTGIRVPTILAEALLAASVLPMPSAVAGTYYPPPESKGGWRTLVTKNTAPTADQKTLVLDTTGLDTDRLVDAWKYVESLGQRQSLLVIRHGWIAGEWDYVGLGPVNSSTKSLTGLALAKLFELSDAGRLPRRIGYDDFAYHYLPDAWGASDPRKKLIKVRDLPTMCSGLQAMDRGIRDLDAALALPVVHPPETIDQYSSAGVMLEGMVIENASGQSLKSFFRQHLSEPIGAESVRLWDAHGAAGYAFMHTRDFARFGYLMLHQGAWDDGRGRRQLVRADLVAKCTQWPPFLGNVTDGPGNNTRWLTTADPPSHFLHTWHGWWVNCSSDWPASQQPVWPFVPKDAFWMSGYGKDICVVIPSLDMVIAHQTARTGKLEQILSECPEFCSTLMSKVMAAVVTPSGNLSAEPAATVERWDAYERSFTAAGSYANPFQDVTLTATFTHASLGTRLTVDGFHDGGSTWRLRFMPLQLGTWHWTTISNDHGLDGKTGTLECVTPTKPYLRGPLTTDGFHFRHADGSRRFLISTRLTCQFAPPSAWPPLISFLKANRINRVLFMMPGVDSRKDPVHTQRNLFAPGPDYTRYRVEAFRVIDAFVDTLRQADILASPYFYYDPRREVMWKMTPQQDRAYIRYGMARLGAFSNVMPVLANEVELKTTNYKDPAFDLGSHVWANEMGAFLKSRIVFGQPISVHNPCWHEFAIHPSYFTLLRDWPFAAWTDFLLKQAQLGCIGAAGAMSDSVPQPQAVAYNERSYARHNQMLIDLRKFGQPVINEEPAYDMGSRSAYASQTPETMRPTFWTAAAAGAYTTWGSKATYVTGDPLGAMQGSLTPQYLRVHHDVMVTLPYTEMEPHNECVTPANVTLDGASWRTNFALAGRGVAYLVYSLHGGTGTVTLAPGRYSATRIDPREGARTDLGMVPGGTVDFSLPEGDWVLIYRQAAGGDPAPPVDSPRQVFAHNQPGL